MNNVKYSIVNVVVELVGRAILRQVREAAAVAGRIAASVEEDPADRGRGALARTGRGIQGEAAGEWKRSGVHADATGQVGGGRGNGVGWPERSPVDGG